MGQLRGSSPGAAPAGLPLCRRIWALESKRSLTSDTTRLIQCLPLPPFLGPIGVEKREGHRGPIWLTWDHRWLLNCHHRRLPRKVPRNPESVPLTCTDTGPSGWKGKAGRWSALQQEPRLVGICKAARSHLRGVRKESSAQSKEPLSGSRSGWAGPDTAHNRCWWQLLAARGWGRLGMPL